MPTRFTSYQLRSLDVDAARAFYERVFGDQFWGSGIDVVPLPARPAARGVPGYWLGHIGVDDPSAREGGALVLAPTTTADGHRVVACDDPQGAAFGIYETAAGSEERR